MFFSVDGATGEELLRFPRVLTVLVNCPGAILTVGSMFARLVQAAATVD